MDLAQRFGRERAAAMRERMKEFARGFGVTGMNHPGRSPNTRRALAIAEYARDKGLLDAFRDSAMRAHWRDGMNLEDDSDLRQIAARAGLDPEQAVAASRDPLYLARIDAIREEAHALGVDGIPTFIFGDHVAVVGCQRYEVLAEAARKAGARKRA